MTASIDETRVAWLAGASGLVGGELCGLLCGSPLYQAVHALVRRGSSARAARAKLVEHQVSFEQLPALPKCDDVYIALGTTIKQAGSQQAFRLVDHDYVLNVARAGLASGARRLALVSALGAEASSRVFYNRVKGELENSIKTLGYESVVIAQPSLLLGDRHALGQHTRTGEVWASRLLLPLGALIPAAYRPVQARDVAVALLQAMLRNEPGVVTLQSRSMHGAAG